MLGRLHHEGLVQRARLRAGHRRLKLPEDRELLFQGHVRRGRHRANVLDGVRHLPPRCLEGRHRLGQRAGKGRRPRHVVHVRHEGLEDAVGRGEGPDHLVGAGLGRLAGERRHAREYADGLVAQAGDGGLHIIGRRDELRLARSRPLVRERFRRVFDSVEVLDAQRGEFTEGLLRFDGRSHERRGHREHGQARADHHGALLDTVKVARHPFAGRRNGRIQRLHRRLNAHRVPRKRVLHRDDNAQAQVVHTAFPKRLHFLRRVVTM